MRKSNLKAAADRIRNLFSGKSKTGKTAKEFRKTENLIAPAFSLAGRQFYQFTDFRSIPALRAIQTNSFYEECKSNTPAYFLKLHGQAMKEILLNDKNTVDIFKLWDLNQNLIERLNAPVDIATVFKLASIIYFDADEDVTIYDTEYNRKKIAFWQKHKAEEILSLKTISELVPLPTDDNLDNYQDVSDEINHLHLDMIMRSLPKQEVEKLQGKTFFNAVVLPQN